MYLSEILKMQANTTIPTTEMIRNIFEEPSVHEILVSTANTPHTSPSIIENRNQIDRALQSPSTMVMGSSVPDEPTRLPPPRTFKNPLEPKDLSMARGTFKGICTRDPTGKLYIDNGTRLKCKICSKMCRSKHEFHAHVRTHDAKCAHCHIKFKNWKEFEKHVPSCTRKNGIVRIPRRPIRNQKKERRPFQCQLCNRKYLTYAHLFNHQVQRCNKRYLTDAWIVKI